MHMISLIVPLYNDNRSILTFYNSLVKQMKEVSITYECIFVNNGSPDKSNHTLRELCENDFHFHYISMHHNISIIGAIYIGMQYAQGDVLITMNCEHPTYMLEEFYEAIVKKSNSYVGGILVRSHHHQDTTKQRFFKGFDRAVLQPYIASEDYDGFRSLLRHNHNDMYWIPYTNLETKENPLWVRMIHQLNYRFGRSMIYVVLGAIVFTLFLLPTLLIGYFHLDSAYSFYIAVLCTFCILSLIQICHSHFCCLHVRKQLEHIKESTYE